MTTVTAEQIIDRWTSVILGLVPGSLSDLRYHRSPARYELRPWALKAGSGTAVTRAFEVRATGPRQEPPTTALDAARVSQEITVLVAYSAKLVALYGRADLDDLEDVVEADAKQLHDAIQTGTGLAGPGHQCSIVVQQDLERSHPEVWFQRLTVDAQFFVSQSLTF